MEHSPLRVAIVGQGRSGYDIHVARLRNDSRFRIVAVADFDKARREQSARELGCKTYRTHAEMLRRTDAELVIVSSYSFSHAPIACQALEAGKHVLVEKPIAMNTRWVDRMIRARDQSGKCLFPFHNYRYTKEYLHLKEMIASGILGDVFEIRMRALAFSRRNDWQTTRLYGGGVLNNTCPHFLDLLLQMLQSPVAEVFTDLKLVQNVGDVENHVRVIIKGRNGRIADMLVSSADAFPEPKWTILGSNGTLICDGRTSELRYFDPGDLQKGYGVRRGPSPNRSYDFADSIPWKQKTVAAESHVPHDLHDNVFAVLRENAAQDITVEDVRDVVAITERARRKDGFYGGVSRAYNPER
ncbi:MAG TPA: Gfo/Idh/MocA family oxidoreductase [Candidatus Latescibacteria bacterium]|nr:Gfo/Idh/MocA family oxidoreductase [Candidatus Latescibacterota bacterium]